MYSAVGKAEQEARLSRRIGEIKMKNAELLRRHQLAEEDRRLAEELGCSVTLRSQETYTPMRGEILRAMEDEMEREAKQQKSKTVSESEIIDKPKVEYPARKDDGSRRCTPSCQFLADELREGPLDPDRERKISRRHPWNSGGRGLQEVPEKVCDPNEKMMKTADFAICSAGKERERRESVEWRKEREKIDRQRVERQKDKDGNWKREWDRDKDYLSYSNPQNKPRSAPSRQQSQSASRPGSSGGFIVLR